MKQTDIKYVNSWEKSFKKGASMVDCVRAVIEGVWASGRDDVEDIILHPHVRIEHNTVISSDYVAKQYGVEPIELQVEVYDYKNKKDKWINIYLKDKDKYWSFDLFEMRKAVTKRGLEFSKKYNITEEEIRSLFDKYHYDDEAAYKDLMNNRLDLYQTIRGTDKKYEIMSVFEYSTIRAAYCPCLDPYYNWCNDLDKAGITKAQQEEFAYEKMKDYINYGDISKLNKQIRYEKMKKGIK